MKKLFALLLCLVPVVAWAAIGNNTSLDYTPACLNLGQQYHFGLTIHFFSPDGERLRFAQFWTGDFWDVAAVQDPAAVNVAGTWSHNVNPAGNVISWTFSSQSGYGGDVGNGNSITFTFDATATAPNDLGVLMYIEGDTSGGTPHTKSWSFTYPLCADDDTADDDVDDDIDDDVDDDTDDDIDDDVDDDATDDDATDDDADDDDAIDDDAADDDVADDDLDDDGVADDDSGDDDGTDDDATDGGGGDDDNGSDSGSACGF